MALMVWLLPSELIPRLRQSLFNVQHLGRRPRFCAAAEMLRRRAQNDTVPGSEHAE